MPKTATVNDFNINPSHHAVKGNIFSYMGDSMVIYFFAESYDSCRRT